ncbi:hypothetical protein NE237_027881 [Protea cynaroides]|uniref:RING-type E3 ubiquitin transferase n=1 Tax=Protea cynaroides TaxID=273540 RepID=A0A9Q0JSC5_9MAGN|nr:hypothetical protein NE237_027881 [Protea cynaroides]
MSMDRKPKLLLEKSLSREMSRLKEMSRLIDSLDIRLGIRRCSGLLMRYYTLEHSHLRLFIRGELYPGQAMYRQDAKLKYEEIFLPSKRICKTREISYSVLDFTKFSRCNTRVLKAPDVPSTVLKSSPDTCDIYAQSTLSRIDVHLNVRMHTSMKALAHIEKICDALERNNMSKIGDVGLAKLVSEIVPNGIKEYRDSILAGTLCYMDPECQRTDMATASVKLQGCNSFCFCPLMEIVEDPYITAASFSIVMDGASSIHVSGSFLSPRYPTELLHLSYTLPIPC